MDLKPVIVRRSDCLLLESMKPLCSLVISLLAFTIYVRIGLGLYWVVFLPYLCICCSQSTDAFDRYEQVSSVPGNHLPARPVQLPATNQQNAFSQGTVEPSASSYHDLTFS